MKRKTIAAAAILGGTLALAGCSTVSTDSDEVALHVKSGPFEDKKCSGLVPSGTNMRVDGGGDLHFVYPHGQRTYTMQDGFEGAESGSVSFVAAGGIEMKSALQATFTLNTDFKSLCDFHERIGLKYQRHFGDEWWATLLNDYLGKQIDRALDDEAKAHDWRAIRENPAIKDELERKAGETAVRLVHEQSGGNYFCSGTYSGKGECGSFSITLKNPGPANEGLVRALEGEQVAAQDRRNAEARGAAVDAEAANIEKLIQKLGAEGYLAHERNEILRKAVEGGKVPILPVPQGSDITIPTK